MARAFRGWHVVGAAVVGQSLSNGALLVFTFGVFAKPIAKELGTSRAAIALAVLLFDLVGCVAAPFAGRLADRAGARRLIATSHVALGLCVLGISFVHSLAALYALYAIVGLLGVATTPVTYSRVVANWFTARRGLALGVASCGIGIGAFAMPSSAQLLIDEVGWRNAYRVLAIATIAIAAPIVAIVVRGRPEEVGLAPHGARRARREPPGASVAESLRSPVLWQLLAVFSVCSACINGAMAHLAPLLTDAGASGRFAALATSMFGAATIVGRVACGWLVDRFFAPRVVAMTFAAASIGLAMLWSGVTGGAVLVAALLLGLAMGAESDVMPFLVSRYFGLRSMATLFGIVFGVYIVGFATGRYLYALAFDTTGSYRMPLGIATWAVVAAALATARLRPYPSLAPEPA